MSTPNPALVAAAPSLLAIIAAAQTLITNVGNDPLQFAVKWPGALEVFLGTVEMQVPGLATAEFGVVQTNALTRLGALATQLKALSGAPVKP